MILRIFAGLAIAIAGASIVIYTEGVLAFFGSMAWADKWLGTSGGSRLAYKLIGLLLVAIGFMLTTNLLGGVLLWLFSGLFSGFASSPSPL